MMPRCQLNPGVHPIRVSIEVSSALSVVFGLLSCPLNGGFFTNKWTNKSTFIGIDISILKGPLHGKFFIVELDLVVFPNFESTIFFLISHTVFIS